MLLNQSAPAWALDETPPITHDDYAGRPVLLFFFNTGCDGCLLRGLPLAREIATRYPELQVIGIHSNFGAFAHLNEASREAVAALDLPFPVYMDAGHRTYDAYQAEGTPHWAFIDAEGVVRHSIFGSQAGSLQRLEYLLMEQFG